MDKLLEKLTPLLEPPPQLPQQPQQQQAEELLGNLLLPPEAKEQDTLLANQELYWNTPVPYLDDNCDHPSSIMTEDHSSLPLPEDSRDIHLQKESEDIDMNDADDQETTETGSMGVVIAKWIIIRKFGKRGGVKVQVPISVEKLLEIGGERLGIKPIKVREVKSEAEIDHVRALKEDDIVWLMTTQDELQFS
jgi:hypothetical protein